MITAISWQPALILHLFSKWLFGAAHLLTAWLFLHNTNNSITCYLVVVHHFELQLTNFKIELFFTYFSYQIASGRYVP